MKLPNVKVSRRYPKLSNDLVIYSGKKWTRKKCLFQLPEETVRDLNFFVKVYHIRQCYGFNVGIKVCGVVSFPAFEKNLRPYFLNI